MAKDERLYMTFPNDFHRHPKLNRIPVEARWAFVEIVGERAISGRSIVPAGQWEPEVLDSLAHAGLIRIEGDGIVLVENGMWGIVRPYRAPIPASVRSAIYARDRYACRACGDTDNLQIDHIFPWSRGGADEPSNLQTLCAPCNQSKGAKIYALVQGRRPVLVAPKGS